MTTPMPVQLTLASGATLDSKPSSQDVERAFAAITVKRALYNVLYQYYDGRHPTVFSTEKLQAAFGSKGLYFAINWVAVVVDTLLDRLIIKDFDTKSKTANQAFSDFLTSQGFEAEASDIHEAVAITDEAYMIVGEDEDGKPEVYANDPRMCHMFYNPERPKKKLYAAKLWTAEDDTARMDLYYPNRIEHWQTSQKAENVTEGKAFSLPPDGTETEEVIPVFHFRATRRKGSRELDPAILSIQDAVNKLFSDMMISSEFNSVRQRVIISQADPGDLKTFETWWIPAGDGSGQQSSVQELGGADLNNFLSGIEKLAAAMGIISRTPRHYFFSQGGDPSGDALIAMEAPLIKKAKKKQSALTSTWKEVAAYILQQIGQGEVDQNKITVTWEPVETVQPKASAETVKTQTGSGIPLTTALRRAGWTEAELEQMDKDKEEERKQNSTVAQETLAAMRAQQEQNPNPGTNPATSTEPAVRSANGNTAPTAQQR